MKELVSIIVPAYNVEDYVSRCIESLIVQTYLTIEIIIINDGSTDKTYDKCFEYGKRDSRIRIIQQENKGVSAARNAGLKQAKGDYICFVDSDDYVSPIYVELLLWNIKLNQSDIAIALATSSWDDLIEDRCFDDKGTNEVILWNNKEALYQFTAKKKFTSGPYCKLYKRAVIEDIEFREDLRIAEDKLFVLKSIIESRQIAFQEIKIYYYMQRDGSAMNTEFNEKKLDSKHVVDALYHEFGGVDPDLEGLLYKEKMATYARIFQISLVSDKDFAVEARMALSEEVKKCKFSRIYRYSTKKELLRIFFVKYCQFLLKAYEK